MPPSDPAPFPPDEESVVARALCLAAFYLRGSLERGLHNASDPEHYAAFPELALRLSQWLNEQDFTAHFTVAELDHLSKTPGTWEPELLEARPAQAESLAILLWSLSMQPGIPMYDTPFDPPNLEPLLGWPATGFQNPLDDRLAAFPSLNHGWLRQVVKLRPSTLIANQRDVAEFWRWRIQAAELQAAGIAPPAGMTYPVMIAMAAGEAHAAGAILKPVKNDFPLFEKPFAEISEDELAEAGMIIRARGGAFDWLCGYWTEWDNVATAMD